MEQLRYHLIFTAFKPGINKTEVSFALKNELNLTDAQLADMMAERRTVIRNNLPKPDAQTLGRKLTQMGLVIKAEALAANQKNNENDLRKHLLDGGLEQYFAGSYKHPEDELDTRFSLLILAAFAGLTYFILPFIGLLILRPLISLSIWTSQPFAAIIQLLMALLFFVPMLVLLPRQKPLSGVDLDSETEELCFNLVQSVAQFVEAPKIDRIVLVDSPVIRIHQSFGQWAKQRTTLELGLPVLQSLTLQQFVGLLAMRLTPLSTRFYGIVWGIFILWYNALRLRHKATALLLDSWVLPIHEHQQQRGFVIAREIVGLSQAQRLTKIDQRFNQLNRDWLEFDAFCRSLRVQGTDWQDLVLRESKVDSQPEESIALFRIESPALWMLSTATGYQKVLQKAAGSPLFRLAGATLWKNFQHYNVFRERFDRQLLKPEDLLPPLGTNNKKASALDSLKLQKLAADARYTQKRIVEDTLGLHAKPKKTKDLAKLTDKWRTASAPFWPDQYQAHKLFPLSRSVFAALQTAQQFELWDVKTTLPVEKAMLRDKKLQALTQKLSEQLSTLPALPLIGPGAKALQQIEQSTDHQPLSTAKAQTILNLYPFWQSYLKVYWTWVIGQVFQPKTFAEEAKEVVS